MTKENKTKGIAAADQGMILAQGIIDRSDSEYELMMARKLFNDFYALKMMYYNTKINPNTF